MISRWSEAICQRVPGAGTRAPKYLLLPFCGATLAVLFLFHCSGRFFSPRAGSARAGSAQTSPLGFCALACLVGLFSEQAVLNSSK